MRLHVTELGDASRTAVLIHGLLSDHGAWCRVGPEMVARGYRVLMPDLRGHGLSERADYDARSWAGDLVDTLPRGCDLAVGHSLGGMSLALAVDQLSPGRAVYVDPAWKMTAGQHERYRRYFRGQLGWDESKLRAEHQRWTDADIAARVASMARFDPRCIDGLLPGGGHDHMPRSQTIPSLVMLADPSDLVPATDAERLSTAGFDVVTVPGAGHSIFRDDLGGFLAALDEWLRGS